MSTPVKKLLEELYALEPKLKTREKEIVRIIESMMKNRPEVTIDDTFRAELRDKIMSEIHASSRNKSPFSLRWPLFSGVLACCMIGLLFWNVQTSPHQDNLISFAPTVKKSGEKAFGEINLAPVRDQSGGGGGNPAVLGTEAAVSSVSTDTTTKMVAPDSMIYPPMEFPIYHYVYSGDLKLPEGDLTVYKKFAQPFDAGTTRSILRGFDVDNINLNAFTNLGVSNMTLTEDRDFGYMLNLDFMNGNLSIYQNYIRWPQPVCGKNGCEPMKKITESDIPSDARIVEIAKKFMSDYGISTIGYGEPIIDKSWKIWYARSVADGQETNIPEMYNVTFPLLVDGNIIYEEGGMARGITLNYDVRNNRISSLYGLEKQSLESSEYPAITDMELVKKMIGQGTRFLNETTNPVQTGQKVVDISLGEPELGYIHVYGEWKNGRSDEFYVPAYIFPVTGEMPKNAYYMPTIITIPLVADFVQKVDYNAQPVPLADPAVSTEPAIKE